MWWKICKLLVALVFDCTIDAHFVNSKQQIPMQMSKKTKLVEVQNNGRSRLIESREMYLPIEDNENYESKCRESIQTTSEPEMDSDRNTNKHFMPVRYDIPNMKRKGIYAALSNDPDEKPKVSKGDRSINLSNSKEKQFILNPANCL